MSDQKIIVLSDLHIGSNGSSGWFQPPYSTQLKTFLNQLAQDPTVQDVVLLGDVFDTWAYPVTVVPYTVQEIITTWLDDVFQPLANVVANVPNVYYVNGNHDMFATQQDLDTITPPGSAKKIQLLTPDQLNTLYAGKYHMEHGNLVDMFNAPDSSGDTLGNYPLGFFVTRLVSSSSNSSATTAKVSSLVQSTVADVIKVVGTAGSETNTMVNDIPGVNWLENKLSHSHSLVNTANDVVQTLGKAMVSTLVDLLAKDAGVSDTTLIRFSESALDNQYTIGDIKQYYSSLLLRCLQKPYVLTNTALAGFLPNGLDWYAEALIAQNGIPLVVLGHTHHGETLSSGSGAYDNSGCMCNCSLPLAGPSATYVQILNGQASVQTLPSQ